MSPASAHPTKTDRRKALINLTIDLISDRGIAFCTFRNLAQVNGTTTRPFTYEFGSRSGMLAAVAEETWIRLGVGPNEIADPGGDPLGALRELCSRAVPINGMSLPAMRAYAAVIFESAQDESLRGRLAELDTKGVGVYLDLIRAAQAAGQIPAEKDPDNLIAALWALCDGLLLAAISHPDHFTPQRLQTVWDDGFTALVA
jgi:AcrR family transcriptional regulator